MTDLLVTTMPIKPQSKISVGMCIAPTVAELISKKLGCNNTFSVNLLHSYDDKSSTCEVYLNKLQEFGIEYTNLFIDKEHADTLKEYVLYLYKKGYIVERKGDTLKCKCGMVDIAKSGIRNFSDGDLYYKKDETLYCKKCNTKCEETTENKLYLYLDPTIDNYTNITPNYFQSDLSHFYKNMPGTYILISKNRNTGYQIKVNNTLYNIDIDLLWMNYVQHFEEKNQILIASNHQIFEMYMVNYINKMISNKNLNFVATPYMLEPDFNLDDRINRYDSYYKKLSILYSLRWQNKNCNWHESIIKGIAKLGHEKRVKLYNYIANEIVDNNLEINKCLDNLFFNEVNYQRNMNYIKKVKGRCYV